MRFDARQFIIERRLLDFMYLDGRASHSRVQRFYNVVHASHKLLREYAVAEICSGSFNDSIIDSLYTRKLTSTIKTEDWVYHQSNCTWHVLRALVHGGGFKCNVSAANCFDIVAYFTIGRRSALKTNLWIA